MRCVIRVQRYRIQLSVNSMRNDQCGFKATPGQIRQNRCIGFLQTDQAVDLRGLAVLKFRILVSVGLTGSLSVGRVVRSQPVGWFAANRRGHSTWFGSGWLSAVEVLVVPWVKAARIRRRDW